MSVNSGNRRSRVVGRYSVVGVGPVLLVIAAVALASCSSHNSKPTSGAPTTSKGVATIAPPTTRRPGPKVVVTPGHGLHDGQTVTVTASGYEPGTKVMLMECLPVETNPNPPVTEADSGRSSEPTTSVRLGTEIASCRWPSVANDSPAGTGSASTLSLTVTPVEAPTATVGRDGQVTVSMKVNNPLHSLSGLGNDGADIEYLLIGPVPCRDATRDETSTTAGTTSTTTAPTIDTPQRGCQIVSLGRVDGHLAIRASKPLSFKDDPAPTTTLASHPSGETASPR